MTGADVDGMIAEANAAAVAAMKVESKREGKVKKSIDVARAAAALQCYELELLLEYAEEGEMAERIHELTDQLRAARLQLSEVLLIEYSYRKRRDPLLGKMCERCRVRLLEGDTL